MAVEKRRKIIPIEVQNDRHSLPKNCNAKRPNTSSKIVPGRSAYSQDQYNFDKNKFPLGLKASLNRI
jgi:hypothetical protein